MVDAGGSSSDSNADLRAFLQENRDRILADWEHHARLLPASAGLTRPRLIDFVPVFLDQIDNVMNAPIPADQDGHPPVELHAAEGHIPQELQDGEALRGVVGELLLLRDCIWRLWSNGCASDGLWNHVQREVRTLHQALDHAVLVAIERHTVMRDRLFRSQQETLAQQEKDLAEAEDRFRVTFNNPAIGIAYVALDGTWLRLNRGYCELLGYDMDELTRMRFQDVTHPDDVERDLSYMRRLLAGQTSEYKLEKRYLQKQGGEVWVDLTVSLVRDASGHPLYFIAMAANISRRVKLRNQLAILAKAGVLLASTLQYRKTLEHIVQLMVPDLADWCTLDLISDRGDQPECVAVAHRDADKIALVREMYRNPPHPTDPAGVARVLRTGEPELIPTIDDEILSRYGIDNGRQALLKASGGRSALIVPLKTDQRVIGALTLANAESGRYFTQEDLRFAQEVARRASTALENARLHEAVAHAVDLRDQVLGIVSHDLRNPLNTIELGTGMLLKNSLINGDENTLKQVRMIKRSARRATRLIDDLLDMSGIQAGKLALRTADCDLDGILVEAGEMLEPMARERGIDLRCERNGMLQTVVCDRDRLLQVLANLVGNALKFCSPGDQIILRSAIHPDRAVLSVCDTGPGIAPDVLDHVFELYWKGTEEKRGAGLGLFISKGIVEAHGGQIRVESAVGHGTAFHVIIPRRVKAPSS